MVAFFRGLFQGLSKPRIPSTTSHCMSLVRQYDYENYLCTLFLPRDLIPAAIGIRAFNVEVARIEDVVKEKALGEMRLRFFLEELNNVFDNKPRNHPVLTHLHTTLYGRNVSKQYLKRLVEARIQRIQQPEFQTIEAIEKYTELSVFPIYCMLLQLQGVNNMDIDHYASHIAKAQGIVTVLRSIPYFHSRRINALPGEILMKHGLSSESVFRKTEPEKLRECIYDVASQAAIHLNKADALKVNLERKTKKIFLSRLFTDEYLEKLRRVDFNVYEPKLQKHEISVILKLLVRGL